MNLLKLLADNRSASQKLFAVKNQGDEAEILLYDAIVDDELQAEYFGGVAPKPFIKELKSITAKTIHLRINSPGGSVFAARAMETAIREHSAQIIVHIDGVAASAATFIAMAGDEVQMSEGALFMIHKAWSFAMGNSDDLIATAALLEKVDGTLAKTYAGRTGLSEESCLQLMADETWMTAQEALDKKFVDSITAKASAKKDWNFSAYKNAPTAQAAKEPQDQTPQPNIGHLIRKLEAASIMIP